MAVCRAPTKRESKPSECFSQNSLELPLVTWNLFPEMLAEETQFVAEREELLCLGLRQNCGWNPVPRLGKRKANALGDITLNFTKIWEVPRGIRKR